jgi:hypothetical protein
MPSSEPEASTVVDMPEALDHGTPTTSSAQAPKS